MDKPTTDVHEWVSGLIESAANQPLWKSDQMIGIPFYRLVEIRDRLEAAEKNLWYWNSECEKEMNRAQNAETTIEAIGEVYATDYKMPEGCRCFGCRIKAILDKHSE